MAIASPIREYLNSEDVSYVAFTHPVAFTAQQEAAVAHVPGREWAKIVVCFADDEPIQAVVPAPLHVDLGRLRALAHASVLRLAQEREFKELYPDCEVGAMPPFGPLYHQRVYVDETLAEQDEIVFNAGTHRDAIRMGSRDFIEITNAIVGRFGRATP
jgi:Ala-tRNA(Pro) deacylase